MPEIQLSAKPPSKVSPIKRFCARVAIEDKETSIREAAVQNGTLIDQVVLARVAIEGLYADARLAVIEKITDQNVLAKVAIDNKHLDSREAAILNLTDQSAGEDRDAERVNGFETTAVRN